MPSHNHLGDPLEMPSPAEATILGFTKPVQQLYVLKQTNRPPDVQPLAVQSHGIVFLGPGHEYLRATLPMRASELAASITAVCIDVCESVADMEARVQRARTMQVRHSYTALSGRGYACYHCTLAPRRSMAATLLLGCVTWSTSAISLALMKKHSRIGRKELVGRYQWNSSNTALRQPILMFATCCGVHSPTTVLATPRQSVISNRPRQLQQMLVRR